jgi:hypothetical protein
MNKNIFQSIKEWWHNLRRRWARRVVTRYAKREFYAAMRHADERYKHEHTMIYVCSKPFQPDILTTYDRIRFKREKQVWGWNATLLTLQSLKFGCYYHTPDKAGNQRMKQKDIDVRLQYFINERLALAKLL